MLTVFSAQDTEIKWETQYGFEILGLSLLAFDMQVINNKCPTMTTAGREWKQEGNYNCGRLEDKKKTQRSICTLNRLVLQYNTQLQILAI